MSKPAASPPAVRSIAAARRKSAVGAPSAQGPGRRGRPPKAQAKAAGATGWLTKPFNPDQLITVVKKVLAK